MNGVRVIPDPPEANYFRFARFSDLQQADLFTLTWFYRAFGLYQPVPSSLPKYFSERTIDVADRFISLWICFNSILRKHYGENLNDGQLIKNASDDFQNTGGTINLKQYYDTMSDPEYRGNLEKLKRLLPIRNMKNNQLLDFSNKSLIEIIYAIRCNLFHGRKDPTDTNSTDFELIRLAFFLLAPLVIEYARQYDLIETCVHSDFQISQLDNGICFTG